VKIGCAIYEVLHYVIFSSLPLCSPSQIKIFFSAPCSQTPLIYALPLECETKLHTHTKQQLKWGFIRINL